MLQIRINKAEQPQKRTPWGNYARTEIDILEHNKSGIHIQERQSLKGSGEASIIFLLEKKPMNWKHFGEEK